MNARRRGSLTYAVCAQADEATAQALADRFGSRAVSVMLPAGAGRGAWRVWIYCRSPFDARSVLARVRAAAAGTRCRARVRSIADSDWRDSWKAHFRTTRISERLVVRPPWSTFHSRPGDRVVILDPGMCFGTGRHATTRACLWFLDRFLLQCPRASVLDAGCGSGILSIAAALLGAGRVVGLDNDPDAVRAAAANAAANGVGDRIRFEIADLSRHRSAERFDAIAANLLAGVLIANAGCLADCLAFGQESMLVLSGMLGREHAAVLRAYEPLGFVETGRLAIGEWVTSCLGRPFAARRR